LTLFLVVGILLLASGAFADGEDTTAPAEPAESPPLPLHNVEGTGGVFATHTAYLVNPAAEGEIFGLPSVGLIYVHLGSGRHLNAFTVTETLWDRIELGYAWDHLELGDLPHDIEEATGIGIGDDSVDLHNFNARLLVLKEGDFNQSWLPALTVGVHYKYNDDIDDIDSDLMGTLQGVGIEDNDGVDFTLYATKMITALPRPVLLSAGLRSTKAAHIGLLGFTDEREIVGEGSIIVFVTNQFAVAAEYRQKPDGYDEIPGLVASEDDWWTLCVCYVVNEHMTISGGYGNFGEVLNHEADTVWGLKVKWEF
jgi:hypothetical protein